jgi:hypothetical protein
MKAVPVRHTAEDSPRREICKPEEATHVILNMPGPIGYLNLPVIIKGRREGTNCWTWNGDTERPTLRPSLKSYGGTHTCHSWVNDGQAQFLDDTTHELRGQTVDLLEVPACMLP